MICLSDLILFVFYRLKRNRVFTEKVKAARESLVRYGRLAAEVFPQNDDQRRRSESCEEVPEGSVHSASVNCFIIHHRFHIFFAFAMLIYACLRAPRRRRLSITYFMFSEVAEGESESEGTFRQSLISSAIMMSPHYRR